MKFVDLNLQYKEIEKMINTAVKKVLNNSVFIGGLEVVELEKEIARFCGVNYALGVNSGTDALFLSLKALGIRRGDEVITSPFTFIATAGVIANCGAKPVFVDIDPETFNIDHAKIEKAITKKTKAIIPIHLFGQIADMTEIMRIANKYKLSVVEDAAQAIGARYEKKKAGTIGDVGCFSFFPTKNLGAYGDGGMVITNNKNLASTIGLLKNHGSSSGEKYLNLVLGTNSRLDSIQAAILRVKIKYLWKWNKKRAEIAFYYSKCLKETGDIVIPLIKAGRSHVFHQYTIRTKSRDKLQKYLKEKAISTAIYYPIALHLQPAFRYLGYKKNDFPESEKASNEVLSLPIYPELSKKKQDFIIKTIKKFFN